MIITDFQDLLSNEIYISSWVGNNLLFLLSLCYFIISLLLLFQLKDQDFWPKVHDPSLYSAFCVLGGIISFFSLTAPPILLGIIFFFSLTLFLPSLVCFNFSLDSENAAEILFDFWHDVSVLKCQPLYERLSGCWNAEQTCQTLKTCDFFCVCIFVYLLASDSHEECESM